jgi:hypothetical protein
MNSGLWMVLQTPAPSYLRMVSQFTPERERPLGEVLKTIGGYGFHIYDDGGARWITIRYETEDAAKKARDLIAKALKRDRFGL